MAGVSAYMTKYLGKSLDARSEPEQQPDMADGLEEIEEKPTGIPAGSHRYYRSRNLELLFVEYLEEPGDLTAFQERMEAEGFKMVKEPSRIEKNGIDYGWWMRSIKVTEKIRRLQPPYQRFMKMMFHPDQIFRPQLAM